MTEDTPIILTTAPSISHAAQIIYGLDLRGIGAKTIHNPLKSTDPHAIILTKGNQDLARSAIIVIWDAMLDATPRATDINGNCYFCGYDTTGLLPPILCPECGHELDSIAARRAASEGRID
ncbi:MAG: hypothetical protein JKY43_07650 [Phycisphaerales bacterium]|nr:hypothetical protein [Phycisphaerales bacterium]